MGLPGHAGLVTLTACRARIEVIDRDGHRAAVACEDIAAGEAVLELAGVLTEQATRHSVQVGRSLHLAPPEEIAPDDDAPAYRWRFLNHSCAPNAALRGRILIALAAIARGEEVTFDYNTTEYDMSTPFACHCGHCEGIIIRGYRHLTESEQQQRCGILADHLRTLDEPAGD